MQSLNGMSGAVAYPIPLSSQVTTDAYFSPITVTVADNGFIIHHNRGARICKNLFEVSKWFRVKAVEIKNEASKTV